MNWEAITAIGELAAAIAVIISLVYVGKQLSQNNRNQRIAALQAHNEAFRENLAMLTRNPDLWVLGLNNYPNLSPGENAEFSFQIHSSFRHLEQAYLLNKEGVLSDDALNKSMLLICGLYFYPGCKSWWDSRKEYFNDEFKEKIEVFFKKEDLKKLFYGNVDNT